MTRGPCTSKQTSKRHPSRGGRPELGAGAQPMGPPRSVLRQWSGLLPTCYNLYIYTSYYISHIEFLNKTHLNTENKKVNYFSHDLYHTMIFPRSPLAIGNLIYRDPVSLKSLWNVR
jgi:hypothetical protein